MLKLLLSLLCGFALSVDAEKPFYDIKLAKHYFNDFVATYNKIYGSEGEKSERQKIFTDNLIVINKMNAMDTAIYREYFEVVFFQKRLITRLCRSQKRTCI